MWRSAVLGPSPWRHWQPGWEFPRAVSIGTSKGDAIFGRDARPLGATCPHRDGDRGVGCNRCAAAPRPDVGSDLPATKITLTLCGTGRCRRGTGCKACVETMWHPRELAILKRATASSDGNNPWQKQRLCSPALPIVGSCSWHTRRRQRCPPTGHSTRP